MDAVAVNSEGGGLTMDFEDYISKHFHYHPDGTITRDDRKNERVFTQTAGA